MMKTTPFTNEGEDRTAKTVLVATLGTAPAVISEAVWALLHETPPVLPHLIVAITTSEARQKAVADLLAPQAEHSGRSVWAALREEAELLRPGAAGLLRFEDSAECFRVIADQHGDPLVDVQTTEQNRVAAEFILGVVREFTDQPGVRVIAVQAGGRKTMVSLLHSALSLAGREGDRLLHIHVNQPFERMRSQPVFYFPTRDIPFYQLSPSSDPVAREKIEVWLSDVPFSRLGPLLRVAEAKTGAAGLDALALAVNGLVQQAADLFPALLDRDNVLRRTPMLRYYSEEEKRIAREHSFSGMRVILVLHCLPNLLSFGHALISRGLEPALCDVFIKPYPYPQKEEIVTQLRRLGMKVFDEEGALEPGRVSSHLDLMAEEGDARPILIVEDGGYFAPLLAGDRRFAGRLLGAIEQTTRGRNNTHEAFQRLEEKRQKPGFPVVSLPAARIKREFEPEHIARAVLKSIDSMIPDYFEGMAVGIFSCGSIGWRVAQELVHFGARVKAYDPKWVNDPRRSTCPFEIVDHPVYIIRHAQLIIGASGRCSLDESVISSLASSPHQVIYLASASSERIEFNLEALAKCAIGPPEPIYHEYLALRNGARLRLGSCYNLPGGKKVHLLADGMPVNFLGFSGMKDRAADLIMTLLFLAAFKLARGDYRGRSGLLETIPGNPDGESEMDRVAEEFHVGLKFNQLFTLQLPEP